MSRARDEPDPDEVDATVLRILRGVLQRPDLAFDRTLRAADVPGWDSIRMVDILLDLEDAFGIRLPVRIMSELRTVGDLADAVRAQRAAS